MSSFALSLVALLWLCAAAGVRADGEQRKDPSVEACVDDAERGQAAQKRGALLEARASLLRCGVEHCPAVVRDHCIHWLLSLEAELPSLVIHARDQRGNDIAGVRVWVDGVLRLERLEGRSLELDPGVHELRAVVASGASVEHTVVLSRGEQHRVVTLGFPQALDLEGRPWSPPLPSAQSGRVSPARARAAAPRRSLHAELKYAYLLGGVGFGALVGGAVIWRAVRRDFDRIDARCSETPCSMAQLAQREADHAALRPRFVAAPILLGVSVLAFGFGLYEVISAARARSSAVVAARPDCQLALGCARF